MEGDVEFLGHDSIGGVLTSMSDSHKEQWGLVKDSPFKVRSMPFNKVIDKVNVKKVDFLSIDVEGGELEVLKTFDWNIPVYIVLIELDGHNPEKDKKCQEFLVEKGFEFDMRIGINDLWINEENKI